MTYTETSIPSTERLPIDDIPTPKADDRPVLLYDEPIGPRHFTDFIHEFPIGPQEASDYSRPLLEIRALDVATAAVHNVVHYESERRRFAADVLAAANEGTINLTRGSQGGPLPHLVDQFVTSTLEQSIAIVNSEDPTELYAESLKTIERLQAEISALQRDTDAKQIEQRNAHLKVLRDLRDLYIARHPSALKLAAFDVTAGIATAAEVEQVEAAQANESTGSLFRTIMESMFGRRPEISTQPTIIEEPNENAQQ